MSNHIFNISNVNIYTKKEETEIKPVKTIDPRKKQQWSKKIRERGNYTCAYCGQYNKSHVEAHHLFPIRDYPELVYDLGNGIVLCQSCHSRYHKLYQGRESPYTFLEWLNLIEEAVEDDSEVDGVMV